TKQTGLSLAADLDKVPLVFYHNSRHFTRRSVPYPRIIIGHNLPHQNASYTLHHPGWST
ncbi:hypothetical protein EDB80DRAFT_596635, partial [Ilyonectria destructans]